MMKINDKTELKLDLKTVISMIVITATFVGMYYTLESDIEEAKKMPPAVIDRIEYDLKQEFFIEHIRELEEEVGELYSWYWDLDAELHHNSTHVNKSLEEIKEIRNKPQEKSQTIIIKENNNKKNRR